VIELVHIWGYHGMMGEVDESVSTYPPGRMILDGKPIDNRAFWFREGTISPHPGTGKTTRSQRGVLKSR
jgi:hypothetical protein